MSQLLNWAQPILSIFTLVGAGIVSYFHNKMDAKMAARDTELLGTLDAKLEKFQTKEVADLQYQLQSAKTDNMVNLLTEIKGSVVQRIESLEKSHRRGQN